MRCGSRSTPARPAVARAAVAAGATIINDVSATLWPVAAETGAGWVAMHMPADPSVMQQHAHYDDVVAEVRDYLVERAELARSAGVARGVDRPRDRLRQDGPPQPAAAPPPRRPGRDRVPGRDRDQPQVVPRDPGAPAGWHAGAAARPAGSDGRHHDLGHRPRCRHRPGPRRGARGAGRLPGRWRRCGPAPSGLRRPPAVARPRSAQARQARPLREDPGHEGQVGPRHPAPVLRLDHQGSPGGQRAPGRVRPQPPQGAPPRGDPVAAGRGLHPGGVACSRLRTTCTPTTSWA